MTGTEQVKRAPAPRGRRWTLFVPVVCVVAGVGFAASARDSRGTDLRAPGVTSLADTVRSAEGRVRTADARLRVLQRQAQAQLAAAGRDNAGVAAAQRQLAPARAAAGLTAVQGSGIEVVLDDAPAVDGSTALDDNQRLVHQSDLQAVVNALWAGGADAVTIAGQRVVATSAVRCVGPTLLLNGEVFSPPYRVQAIGPAADMQNRLDASPGVTLFRTAASYYGLRYTVETTGTLRLPAYTGSTTLTYAKAGRS